MIQTDERRPAGAASGPDGDVLTVPSVPDRAADFLAGFDSGRAVGRLEGTDRAWRQGYEVGRAAEAAERDAADAAEDEVAHRRHAAFLAGLTPYDELAERRGEPERAEAHRRLLAERGIA